MRSIKNFFFFLLLFLSVKNAKAGDTLQYPVRIAVLAPLNLDSAFKGYEYNLSNSRIPQYFLSGLDFYTGVMMAVDSLQKENANIEVWVYDTHKQNQTLQQLTNQMQAMQFSLVIASISNAAEQKILSDYSAKNSIPLVSATFPNDVYLQNNPFFLLVNPTWETHIDAIYDYIAKNFKGRKVTLFTRKGSLEDRILKEFSSKNSDHAVTFSTIVLRDDFTDQDVLSHLDEFNQNIVLCGTLYESFGKNLIKILNDNGLKFTSVIMGMPTWSGMGGLTGTGSENLQIVITTPYNYLNKNEALQKISETYKTSYYTRPSDMVLKGYETMYHFSKLIIAYPDTFINRASDNLYNISNDYNFQPIRLTQTSFVPDYLENKKIYYIKMVNGKIESVQ